MGNYIFTTDALIECLNADAEDAESRHDMGGDIVPSFVSRGDAQVYDFTANNVPGSTDRDKAYWRDVGTIDAYHEAHMDLVSIDPVFNLYNSELADLDLPGADAGGEVHAARPRAGLAGQPGLHHLRRLDRELGAVAERPGRRGLQGRPLGAPDRASGSGTRPSSAARSSTRTSSSSTAPRSG